MLPQTPTPIAIIGIGCRLPGGATDTEKLWDLLSEGRSAWSETPENRFNWKSFYHPSPEADGAHNHRGGHFLQQDTALFDAGFFGIPAYEAQAIDPQQRFLLETTVEALENAGLPLENLRGTDTAVYIAMFTRDYDRNLFKDPGDLPKYHVTGVGEAIVSNRISYLLDLHGPSMTLDTGCSGSMVALHLACQSLRTGESKIAIVGGTNLILSPDHMLTMSKLQMLNNDGKSYSFDSRGAGYGRGEGVATLVLKRLEDALVDGDSVRAVIVNSAVNQDGKTQGITLPGQEAQANLERSIFEKVGIDPREVTYIEAHGTGTKSGDLTELKAIASVFCKERENPLYIGSIKPNLGHLESVSGIAGLIKAILILEKGIIPPTIGIKSFKADLRLEAWNMKVPQESLEWPKDKRRLVSVNSFGYGGTNSHAILEAKPLKTNYKHKHLTNGNVDGYLNGHRGVDSIGYSNNQMNSHANGYTNDHNNTDSLKSFRLILLTAKSETSALHIKANLVEWLLTHSSSDDTFDNLAYTLSSRRSIMPWRTSIVTDNMKSLRESLLDKSLPIIKASMSSRVTFLLTGQGAQHHSMARELINISSAFKRSLHKSDLMHQELGTSWSLIEELLKSPKETRINESEIAQPASTALQIALVDQLEEFGIKPRAVIGHSSGEIAAAYAAGALSHEMALKVSYQRSFISKISFMRLAKRGAMLAAATNEKDAMIQIAKIKLGKVVVACVNSPSSVTISGDEEAIDELSQILTNNSIWNRKLKVDTAYHSHHMQEIASEYLTSLEGLISGPTKSSVQFISSVTGLEKKSDFGAEYWVQNLISKVRYMEALQKLCKLQITAANAPSRPFYNLVEIGPHAILAGPSRQCIAELQLDRFKYAYTPSLVRDQHAVKTLLGVASNLVQTGYPVDLSTVNKFNNTKSTLSVLYNLPPYAWDYPTPHWYESRLSKDYRLRKWAYHDLLGLRIVSSTSIEPSWRNIIGLENLPWLSEHVIDGSIVFPGAGYLCMAIEAMRQLVVEREPLATIKNFRMTNVIFTKVLIIPASPAKVEIQISLRRGFNGKYEKFRVTAVQGEVWSEHCSGKISVDYNKTSAEDIHAPANIDFNFNRDDCYETLDPQALYKELYSNGNIYGPNFAAVYNLVLGKRKAIGSVVVPDVAAVMPSNFQQPHTIHPATLDAIFHPSLPLYSRSCSSGSIVPVYISEIVVSQEIFASPGSELRVLTALDQVEPTRRSATAHLLVTQGSKDTAVLSLAGLELRCLGDGSSSLLNVAQDMSFQLLWIPKVDSSYYKVKTDGRQASNCLIKKLARYVRDLSLQQPGLNILQLSATKASDTILLAQALKVQNNVSIKNFDIASTIPAFANEFEAVVKNLGDYVRFTFSDISQDPIDQDHYDLIISLDALDSIPGGFAAFVNIKKLLKPDGRFLMSYNTSDDYKAILLQSDNQTIYSSTFGNAQILYSDDIHKKSLVVFRNNGRNNHISVTPVEIRCTSKASSTYAAELVAELTKAQIQTTVATNQIGPSETCALQIILDDGQNPLLSVASKDEFEQVITILTKSRQVIWVTLPAEKLTAQRSLIRGLARTARGENENLTFVIMDIEQSITASEVSRIVTEVLLELFASASEQITFQELEYVFKNDELQIPRLLADESINNFMSKKLSKPDVLTGLFHQPTKSFVLEAGTPGKIRSLRFAENALSPLQDDELEISVQAFSVSSFDVPIILGQSKGSTLGECAGTVTAIGRNITAFQIDDSVVVIGGKVCASTIRVMAHKVAKLPLGMSFIDGSAKIGALMAAYYSLINLANLRKTQKVLIHDACSSIGQAALRIAQSIGAEIFATITETDNLGTIRALGLPSSHILSANPRVFKQEILQHTKSRGVEVVLNSTADNIQESWDCVAPFGIFIDLEDLGPQKSKRLEINGQGRSARYVAFSLLSFCNNCPKEFSRLFAAVIPLASACRDMGSITSVPLANVEEGFRNLQTGKIRNKLVVEAPEGAVAQLLPVDLSELKLDSEASYMIAGGLGDLGQKLCGMMAKHGARNFLLLSRRQLTEEQKKSLQIKISAGESGIQVRAVMCDITKLESVQKVVAEHKSEGFPPIKGVIQAAMVLQDRILEQMTLADYEKVVKPKVDGTLNLDKVLENLDFFLMLSSLASVIGNKGGGNYAAANAFLDGFAGIRNGCRYLSLNLGMIADSATIVSSQQTQQLLLRQGCIPLKTNELLALIEYSLGQQGESRGLDSAVIGFNQKSLSHPRVQTAVVKNSMLIHVLNENRDSTNSEIEVAQDVKSLIRAAKNPNEIQDIVLTALTKQLSTLLALDDVNVELSVSNFGLDSLMGIELKNWISKEFEASLQTSEVLDSPSLLVLTDLLTTRSQIVRARMDDNIFSAKTLDKPEQSITKSRKIEKKEVQPDVQPTPKLIDGLPRLPLQDLDTVLQNFFVAISTFATEEELEVLSKQITDMTRPDGIGQILQARLAEKAADPKIGNWMADNYDKWNHLLRRAPLIPYGHFYGAHVQPKFAQSQVQKAAIISFSAYKYKKLLEAGQIKQDELNEQLQCMNLYQYIFNTTREPRANLDRMSIHEGEHAVVLRNGHMFEISLQNKSVADLEADFKRILACSNYQTLPVAILTADERTSWAIVRDILKENGNQQALRIVESAAFIVNLENNSPTNSAERAGQFLFGDPSNRWSDKSLQFTVCANGQSACIVDHSMIDGSIVNGLNNVITAAILDYRPQSEEGIPDAKELIFNVNGLEPHVERVQKMYFASISSIEALHFTYSDFGGRLFSAQKCPPKTGFQLIIQLAAYQYFGYQVPSWETSSLRSFYRGRVDIIQTVVPAVAAFNASGDMLLIDRRKLFFEAAKAHANLATSAARGRGYDRHLTSLKFELQAGEKVPEFFANPVYERTRPRKLVTDYSNTTNPEAGIALRDPDGLWIHYEVEDDSARFSVIGTKGRLSHFQGCFDAVAHIVRNILELE